MNLRWRSGQCSMSYRDFQAVCRFVTNKDKLSSRPAIRLAHLCAVQPDGRWTKVDPALDSRAQAE